MAAKPGPQRTPLKVLARKGSKRSKGRPEDKLREIKEVEGQPIMPKGLDAEAKGHWKDLAGWLDDMELATPQDADVMKMYSVILSRYDQAMQFLKEHGEYFTGANGVLCLHPLSKKSDVWQRQLMGLSDRLGLSPSARASLGAPVKTKAPDKSVERFFQARRPG